LDSTSGLGLAAHEELEGLIESGWRDAFREIHGDEKAYSFWNHQGAYRIDHALLSPAVPPAKRADYILELDGFSLGEPNPAAKSRRTSDHAALVVDL
jgi:exonuclease III